MIRVVTIRLRWSNAYLLVGDSMILVDTGTADECRAIEEAVRREGLSPGAIDWILHTHGHPDHCGNTAELKKRLHAQAAIHKLDEPYSRCTHGIALKPTGIAGQILSRLARLPAVPFVPDSLLEDDETLDEYGVAGRIVHTPGHTPGSISIVVNSREAIAGDLLMGGCLGGKLLRHVPQFHYFSEDLDQNRESLSHLLELGVQQFHVGHGGPLDRAKITRKQRLYMGT